MPARRKGRNESSKPKRSPPSKSPARKKAAAQRPTAAKGPRSGKITQASTKRKPRQDAPHSQTDSLSEELTASGARPRTPFPIVGIGASAGGLEALQEFFSNLPQDSGCAFVVVTHIHREHTSMLPELLARTSAVPVVEASEGQRVEINHVYVAPSGDHLIIDNGILRRQSQETDARLPIDLFLRALATDQREHAICVILSGTGSDGTLGLRAVKGEAGMAMVQRPRSAKFAGMPASAEATGLADYVLAPADMPSQLVAYVDELRSQAFRPTKAAQDFPAEELRKILNTLRLRTGNDFTSYKPSTIHRRIQRRMNVHRVQSPEEYTRFLKESKPEANLLFRELLINVTSFFRDPSAFRVLDACLCEALRTRQEDREFRVWIPGCATGEEAYSIAIVLHECLAKLERRIPVQIFATDLDTHAINFARQGIYASGIAADVTSVRLKRYFNSDHDNYRINKDIRAMVVFAPHNVLSDPPFTRMDMVVCRNLLIYFESDLQKHLLPTFHYSLRRNGILFLGPSETIGPLDSMFELIDRKWKIYRRKETGKDVHLPPYSLPRRVTDSHDREEEHAAAAERAPHAPPRNEMRIQRVLLEKFAPTCLIVEDNGAIVYIQGRTGMFLEPNEGEPNVNALQMARDGLATPLANAMRKAIERRSAVSHRNVSVRTNHNYTNVDITVTPFDEPESMRGLLLVELNSSAARRKPPAARPKELKGRPSRLAELEEELRRSKESLQSTVEELESANEELKSANEELQSMNEELHSTNEELETSKEELQSLNEELSTVNAELNSKVEELSRSSDDMQNLLNGIEVATIFLDENLRIKRYTEQARDLIHLVPTDVGRPLSDLALHVEHQALIDDCRKVLRTLERREQQVRASDGDWLMMRILPYRTSENVIDGVVVTFVSIGQLKRAEDDARDARHYYDTLALSVREPFLILDANLQVRTANDAFYRTFQLDRGDVEGRRIYEIDHKNWDTPDLRRLLDEVVPDDDDVRDFEIFHESSRVGRRRFMVNARRIRSDAGDHPLTLLAMEDVTDRDQ